MISLRILFDRVSVLLAVDLDAKLCRVAIKVEHIRPRWMLASEAQANLLVLQDPPENQFRLGHLRAQLLCSRYGCLGTGKLHAPSVSCADTSPGGGGLDSANAT